MNEIEAISVLETRIKYPNSDTYGGMCEAEYQQEAVVLALEALREKAERERGCEWCKIGLRFECYLVDDDGHTASIQDHVVQTVIADFCPICGKRLEVEP